VKEDLGDTMKNILKMLAVSTALVTFSACNTLEEVAPTEETQTDTTLELPVELGITPMPSGGNTLRWRRLGWLSLNRACEQSYGPGFKEAVWVRSYAVNFQCQSMTGHTPQGYENSRNMIAYAVSCQRQYGQSAKAYYVNYYSGAKFSNWFCWA
jgi:hypothetical protein